MSIPKATTQQRPLSSIPSSITTANWSPRREMEPRPRGVATDESTRAMPAVGSHEGGHDESRDEVAERTASKPDT